jgi:hypothetical protein
MRLRRTIHSIAWHIVNREPEPYISVGPAPVGDTGQGDAWIETNPRYAVRTIGPLEGWVKPFGSPRFIKAVDAFRDANVMGISTEQAARTLEAMGEPMDAAARAQKVADIFGVPARFIAPKGEDVPVKEHAPDFVPGYVSTAFAWWKDGGNFRPMSDGGAVVMRRTRADGWGGMIKLTASDRAAFDRMIKEDPGMETENRTYAEMAERVWREKTADPDIFIDYGRRPVTLERIFKTTEERNSHDDKVVADVMRIYGAGGVTKGEFEAHTERHGLSFMRAQEPRRRLKIKSHFASWGTWYSAPPEEQAQDVTGLKFNQDAAGLYTAARGTKPLFVAVIDNGTTAFGLPVESGRGDGTFSAFVGNDLAIVTKRAINQAREYNRVSNRQYTVHVGELTEEARERPVQIETLDIQTGRRTNGGIVEAEA